MYPDVCYHCGHPSPIPNLLMNGWVLSIATTGKIAYATTWLQFCKVRKEGRKHKRPY